MLQQESAPFRVPVVVVAVLVVCAALLVMNGARLDQKPDAPDRRARASGQKPDHAKPRRADADESSVQTDPPVPDPIASDQLDNPDHGVPSGGMQEPELIEPIPPGEHLPDAE